MSAKAMVGGIRARRGQHFRMKGLMLPLVPLALCVSGPEGHGQVRDGEAAFSGSAALACVAEGGLVPLPQDVRESSGIAASARDAIFWTHNDAGNDPELFAIDQAGRIVQRVRVPGISATDWEDVEAGPCGEDRCLFIGDIGDNDGERDAITIFRVPEPDASATETAPPVALHARFPDGPRDAESLFEGPDGDLFIVSKGREGPIELFRYPSPQRPEETVTLEPVSQLLPPPADSDDRVTAATASPDGRWVAIRTYRTLYLHSLPDLVAGGPFEPIRFDLAPLGQSQGESLALTADGSVWLTAEADGDNATATLGRLRCELPG